MTTPFTLLSSGPHEDMRGLGVPLGGHVWITLGHEIMSRRSFGKIRRLPSGRFQASYVGPDRTRHPAPSTYTTRMDAEGWLRDERRRVEAEAEDWTSPEVRAATARRATHATTFEEHAERWLATRRTNKGAPLRPSTVAGYRTTLEKYLVPAFGAMSFGDFDPERGGVRGVDLELRPEPGHGQLVGLGEARTVQGGHAFAGQRVQTVAEQGLHLLGGHLVAGVQAVEAGQPGTHPHPGRLAALVVVGRQPDVALLGGVLHRHDGKT